MIVGTGTDIVEIERIANAVRKRPELLSYVLSSRELELAAGLRERRKNEFLAGRWAAKEAFAKALGTGIGEHCSFDQITILPDKKGCPAVTLSGAAEKTFAGLGAEKIHLSISHERNYAVATVILEG